MTPVPSTLDDTPITETGPVTPAARIEELEGELHASMELNGILSEGLVDLELAMEDSGWQRFAAGISDEFTPQGRRTMVGLCRAMAISNPLIKRGLLVRIGYIWGQGVEVTARVGASETTLKTPAQIEQQAQVNGLIDDFESDNSKTLTGSAAAEELERALGTDGEIFLAFFTSPLTGRVQVRSTPVEEIQDIIYNPEDRDEPWFYVREYTVTAFKAAENGATTRSERRKMIHPALGYRPAQRVIAINGVKVRWDAPMKHVPVNRLDGWRRGIPDVYAAIAWARMYRDFLVDWAGLTKALSKIAWALTGDTKSRASKAAAAARAQQAPPTNGLTRPDGRGQSGQTVAMGPGNHLEAVSKTGATIDANSGKPLAGMAAAGVGLPVTMLLADPGVTGARATAETLDRPTILEMGMRRLMWQSVRQEIYEHVILSAVEAPKGRLRGVTTIDDWGRKHTVLTDGEEPVLEFSWPPLADLDPVKIITAIVEADATGKMPPLTTVRLLLQALGVPNADEILETMVDEEGRFIDPRRSAGDVAVDAARDGRDPAGAVR